jgi:phosphatidate phosphatase LPIN
MLDTIEQSAGTREKANQLVTDDSLAPMRSVAGGPDTGQLSGESPDGGGGHEIVYGKDVVLDMAGYHSAEVLKSAAPGRSSSEVRTSVLDTFARDLMAAIPADKRPAMTLRSTNPDMRRLAEDIESIADDQDSPEDVADREARRHDRAKSEPPAELSEPISPTLDPSKTAVAMDYAWDWGRIPDASHGQGRGPPERRESLPPLDPDASATAPAPRLKNVEENPYLFVFDADGRSHTFELSLSGDVASDGGDEKDHTAQSAFLDHRVTFQKFIESPEIVDDPRLVVRYSLQ